MFKINNRDIRMASVDILFAPVFNFFNADLEQVNICWKASFMQHLHTKQEVSGEVSHMNTRVLRVLSNKVSRSYDGYDDELHTEFHRDSCRRFFSLATFDTPPSLFEFA